MGSLKSLYWNQGLFLKPQHFQQFELQTSALANALSKARTGVDSGFSKLDIDDSALSNNMLVINDLECIFGDGSWHWVYHGLPHYGPVWGQNTRGFVI